MEFEDRIKVLTMLKKILTPARNRLKLNEEELKEKEVYVMSSDNVIMAIGKTPDAKDLLCHFLEKDYDDIKKPNIVHKVIGSSSFTVKYIMDILNVIKITNTSVRIQTSENMPVTIETEDFTFYLANRDE